MADVNLMPIAGINNVGTDEELQVRGKEPSLHLRDAVNVDVSAAYRPSMRAGVRKVSSTPLANLWHSPLHADTFDFDERALVTGLALFIGLTAGKE